MAENMYAREVCFAGRTFVLLMFPLRWLQIVQIAWTSVLGGIRRGYQEERAYNIEFKPVPEKKVEMRRHTSDAPDL